MCVFAAFVQLTQFQMELKRKQHVNFDGNNFIFLLRSFVHSCVRLLMLSMSHNPLSFLGRLWEFKRCVCDACVCLFSDTRVSH